MTPVTLGVALQWVVHDIAGASSWRTMAKTPLLIALAFLGLPGLLSAQELTNAYMVTDPNGREVYMIPECIVEKTVSTTLSLPGAEKPQAPLVSTTGGGFVVQVGAFARRRNAERVERLLAGSGFQVRTSSAFFRGKGVSVTVVSAGTFPTRAAAEAAARTIDRKVGVTSLIVPPEAGQLAAR